MHSKLRLVPGMPGDSLLVERVAGGEMPPKKPLAPAEVDILRKWIDEELP